MGKKSQDSVSRTIYGNTTTTNPYVTSQTTNKGTTTAFNKGTAFDSINKFVNNNMNNMLDEYLNPTLNTVTNKSKMNSYLNNLNKETALNLENNIINPLSKRNMLRSSQATNMYKNLAQTNANNIADYTNQLLAGSQEDTAKMLSNLMLWYMNGYNTVADNQRQSLSTSQGNATRTQATTDSSMDPSQMIQMALQVAMLAAGV